MCKDLERMVEDRSEWNTMQVSIILIVKMLRGLPPSNIMLHAAGNVSLSLQTVDLLIAMEAMIHLKQRQILFLKILVDKGFRCLYFFISFFPSPLE